MQFREDKQELERKLQKAKKERQNVDGQMRELQDQLEAEQYFSVTINLSNYVAASFETSLSFKLNKNNFASLKSKQAQFCFCFKLALEAFLI